MKKLNIIFLALSIILPCNLNAEQTQKVYLSGKGNDSTLEWDFFCTDGRKSGEWTKIGVPSCWECQGFGQYTYGHMKKEDRLNESGIYKYSFETPKEWKGKKINIVFEGVMTDAVVKINGKAAGEKHQGAFYEFKYDISRLLKYGSANILEVKVDKSSSNESVVHAEREADFWVFGGIFRPVYLEVKPALSIDNFSIDAKADGKLSVQVALSGKAQGAKILAEVRTLDGKPFGEAFEALVSSDNTAALDAAFNSPALWSAEFPNLYKLKLSVISGGKTIHSEEERFGFRTIEFRAADGIYLNGAKIKFRGVDRHSHHPETGRTLNDRINLEDALLIKEMNMNAVRMSHYPPEKRFLDICDSLGLYAIDELTGWQAAYDTEVGTKLVKEMILRDRNHPCVLLWANGNEGGFNFELRGEYPKWDPQRRKVIHPWLEDEDVNNFHYPKWDCVKDYLCNGRKVWFPTEFNHGLYDGGHGAGLEDFWNLMQYNSLCAGGFLWDLMDQAVVRQDKNGFLDTDGNHGADGILGPYREKEGSFYTIKDIWSPIQISGPSFVTTSSASSFIVENRYSFTNLKDCKFEVEFNRIDLRYGITETACLIATSPDVEPGLTGKLIVPVPSNIEDFDYLMISAFGPDGKLVNSWTRNITNAAKNAARLLEEKGGSKCEADIKDGVLNGLKYNGKIVPLSNARFVCKGAKNSTIDIENTPNGWVKVSYALAQKGYFDNIGITFDFPENEIKGMKWLGNGPYRVWKNRLRGVSFGLWEKDYNDTATGESWDYPEFKGYHSNMQAADIKTASGVLRFVFESDDLFLRILTPRKQEFRNNDNTLGVFPEGQISVLNGISPVGTKFSKAADSGPQSGPNYSEYVEKRRTTHSTGVFYVKFLPN